MLKRIVFSLGSNVGNRQEFLNLAIENLIDRLHLSNLKKSEIFENKALLLPNSPKEWHQDFLNLAISANINTKKFPPLRIMEIIKNIEINLGRIDRGRWAPREIDIDILAIDNLIIDLGEKLQIPHKELFNRDFFVKTFGEVEPELLEILINA